jgi:microsomal dipeptidase-like Zn-dependent dipeptidase
MLGGVDIVIRITEITDSKKQRQEYSRMFWDNAFQIVKAVDDKTGWDVVAIGTDYDGSITHMDPYESAEKFPVLQQDLLDYLTENRYQEELWFGYTPLELVQKIMHGNAIAFYKRFFV